MKNSIRSTFLVLGSVFFLLGSTGCGDDTPTAPTPTEPVLVTDTFAGTINRNGAATHRFVTASAGVVTVTLANLTPDDTITVGLSVGEWNGSACDRRLFRDEAVKSTVIFGNANAAGELCVGIYDVGGIADTTDYEITVSHP
jgi:hypothetical protein